MKYDLRELSGLAWAEWERAVGVHGDWVARQSAPVLWHGDRRKYFESERRVLTVGVNPGPSMFPEEDPWRSYPGLSAGRCGWREYEAALNSVQLDGWFSQWRRVLDPLSVGFSGGQKGVALHVDLTPVATRVVMTDCPKEVDEDLVRNGVPLLVALVGFLKPDYVVASLATPRWESLKESGGIIEEDRWSVPRKSGRKYEFARGTWEKVGGVPVMWARKVSMAPVSPGREECRKAVKKCFRI